jgi:hypothetical protein
VPTTDSIASQERVLLLPRNLEQARTKEFASGDTDICGAACCGLHEAYCRTGHAAA